MEPRGLTLRLQGPHKKGCENLIPSTQSELRLEKCPVELKSGTARESTDL